MKKIIRLTESDLNRLVGKVLSEQTPQPQVSPRVNPQTGPNRTATRKQNNQFGPYCKIGTAQGIIKKHTTAIGGPNVNMGETGFGLFDASGKLICKISTKYAEGGYVATPSK